jgi:predicted metalloprotease with PDZ domain
MSIFISEDTNLNEFFKQYPKNTENEYFNDLFKDYCWKLRSKKNAPLLPQELEKFVYRLGLKIQSPSKKIVVLFLLNKGIN